MGEGEEGRVHWLWKKLEMRMRNELSQQAGVCVCVCALIYLYAKNICVYGLCKCIALHKSSVVCVCVLVFLCASVMSTQRADLDDKRVILPC